jgi:RNA polymerase sigma-70 factor, ECF subfamily
VEITLIEVPQPDGWPRRPETVVRGTGAVGLGVEGIPWKIPGLGGYMTMATRACWPITRPSLLLQLRDGRSDDAWRTFVTTYAPLVNRYCRKKGLQDADAQDITQTVLLRVRRFVYRPERGRFRHWLITVAAHEIAHHFARIGRLGRELGHANTNEDGDGCDAIVTCEDLDWERIYKARLLEVAIERVRPEFTDEEWRAFVAVALEVVAADDNERMVWVDRSPTAQLARDFGRPVTWFYKLKFRVSQRLKAEVRYLAEELALLV